MAAVTEVAVPDIGDFTDVPVIEVLVAVGDRVAVDDPLVVLESDKATMEVPTPLAGTVRALRVAVGDTVSQGTAIAELEPAGGEDPAATAPADGRPAEAAAATTVESAIAAEEQSAPAAGPPAAAPPADDGEAPAYASPAVRRLARELGVDLGTLQGSGRKGRITKEDVTAMSTGVATTAPAPAPGLAAVPDAAPGERVPLTRIQKRAAANLAHAWQTIPHVTHHEDADITELEAFRKQLNAEQSDVKVTMVALLMKAVVASLDAYPRFASSLDGDELILHAGRHLGFAADTPNGLVVPVIHDADRKGLLQLAAELSDLSGKARAGKLAPQDMSGAVFTISSLGGIGGTNFTPIVNPPQVAILGVVRSATKPVWDGTAFQPRLILPLSLSYDHRVIDGAAAARFCVHLAGVLADLRRVLL